MEITKDTPTLWQELSARVRELRLNEEASTGMIAYFVIVIIGSLFLWIGLGKVIDLIFAWYSGYIAISSIPVSQADLDTIAILKICWNAILFLGCMMPLAMYGYIVSMRDADSEV